MRDFLAGVEAARQLTIVPLADVAVGAVVIARSGTIACRFDELQGVVFGDDRPFPWSKLHEPVAVLWQPGDAVPTAAKWQRFVVARLEDCTIIR